MVLLQPWQFQENKRQKRETTKQNKTQNVDNLEVSQLLAFEFQNGLWRLIEKDDFQTSLTPQTLSSECQKYSP